MAKLSELTQKGFFVKLNYDDVAVSLKVRPHLINERKQEELTQQVDALTESDEEDLAKIKEINRLARQSWCDFCVYWDLKGEDDEVIPLTPEGLATADVPLSLLNDLRRRASEEVETKKKNGRRS